MKKLLTLLPIFLLLINICNGQTFWTENFESGSTSGELVTAYTGPNGAWTLTTNISTTEGDEPNPWYVSCAEEGHLAGVCGTGCASGAGYLGATLHIGSTSLGDMGASYDAGGLCGILYCVTTDRRAESPTINCTGKTGITARFYYIENGDGANDDGSMYYSADNGTTWTLLVNTPKTSVCSSSQGQWALYTIALPASANNNAHVKLGFRWVNNDDGIGTDPSYAIDSLSLSTVGTVTAPVASFTSTATSACQDSCITFTSTSTGTIDSVKWVAAGASIANATSSTTSICFPTAGSHTVTLTAYNSAGSTTSSTVIDVTPTPSPVITKTGHTLSVSGAYTAYQWVNGTTPIAGATNASYTYTTSGTYILVVDSAGCFGGNEITVSTVGITNINATANDYWLSQQSSDFIILHASVPTEEDLAITVYDATGRKIINDTWLKGDVTKQLSTSFIPAGLYIIKLSNNSTSTVLKWRKP